MRWHGMSLFAAAGVMLLGVLTAPAAAVAQGDTVLKATEVQKLLPDSGYASDVAAKYQAYFVAELPIKSGGQSLPPGVYGVGFITDNKFVVTDVGGHDVITVGSSTDEEMKRPTPLQVTTDAGGGFRLYAGRRYVTFTK
jgi:hypothetical protein